MDSLQSRIENMHRRDVMVAWAFIVGLWLAMVFVAISVWPLAPSGAARVVLLIAGAVVLTFNTAAIMAMLRHYREDRDFMYGLDLRFLDEARERRAQSRAQDRGRG
ncbi:hypothetical protein [Paracoccus pacificus]|uniref:Solute:sodium symporter small subunit n=1 Tax=Paracoccus pacificus TaxID=1463598 RepID=A0ABW4RBF4_9RHOB